MKRLVIFIIAFFLMGGNSIIFLAEEVGAAEMFPSIPPSGIIGHALCDEGGNKVSVLLWRAHGRLFWFLQPTEGDTGRFVLYPGDITATQEGRLYEGVEFRTRDGSTFSGMVREALILEFKACGWDREGVRCLNTEASFEIQVPPNNLFTIRSAANPEKNTIEMLK
jgi:hypothetical protein